MDSPTSPFRIDVRAALTEIAASIPVFWIVYQLGFGGDSALMISIGALYGTRLWKKGFFGPVANRVSDAHIPILSPGHALSWCHIILMAGTGAAIDGVDMDRVIQHTVFLWCWPASAVACQLAWSLYRSKRDSSPKN